MSTPLHRLFNPQRFADPLERRQAALLQVILIVLLVGALLGVGFTLDDTTWHARLISLATVGLALLVQSSGLLALHRGRLGLAVLIAALGNLFTLAIPLFTAPFSRSGDVLLLLLLPVTLAGLAGTRRVLMLSVSTSIALVLSRVVLSVLPTSGAPAALAAGNQTLGLAGAFVLVVGALGVFCDRFSDTLRDTLAKAIARQYELEQVRAAQAATIHERTTALQTALDAVTQREAALAQTVADFQASQMTIRELSAPAIPVLPGVLVVPLIGALDSTRARVFHEQVLAAVERYQARKIIVDLTGVPLVDTQVAQVLLQTAAALRLLGARVLLVGIRPEVAQTVVALGIDLRDLASYGDLQAAVLALLASARGAPLRDAATQRW